MPEGNDGLMYLSGFDPVPEGLKESLWQEGMPFHFKAAGGSRAIVVCLHGFGATPYETRPVADACVKMGIDAVAPVLPGHGYAKEIDQKREIVRMTKAAVFNSTRHEVARARERYPVVFIYGQSMGGAIALAIAGEGLVDACATSAPALKLPLGAGFLKSIVAISFNKLNFYIKKQQKPRAFINYSYSYHNSLAAAEMQRVSLHARSMLRSIGCPVLVVHSHNDSTIDPVVTEWVRSRVKGRVELVWFDRSDHTMPLDVQGHGVSAAIASFLARQLP